MYQYLETSRRYRLSSVSRQFTSSTSTRLELFITDTFSKDANFIKGPPIKKINLCKVNELCYVYLPCCPRLPSHPRHPAQPTPRRQQKGGCPHARHCPRYRVRSYTQTSLQSVWNKVDSSQNSRVNLFIHNL